MGEKIVRSFGGICTKRSAGGNFDYMLVVSVHPEMVDFGSGQGRSDFATAGVVRLRRGLQRARTPAWAERCRLWMDTSYAWWSRAAPPSIVRCRSPRGWGRAVILLGLGRNIRHNSDGEGALDHCIQGITQGRINSTEILLEDLDFRYDRPSGEAEGLFDPHQAG